MYLKQAIFKNIAPFGDLNLSFEPSQVVVFSGINGRGKTTFLSYIADAFFEIAKQARFGNTFEDITKFYRLISSLTQSNGSPFSLVYLRFSYNQQNIDYLEIVGTLEESSYESSVTIENKIPFTKFAQSLNDQKYCKMTSASSPDAREVFTKNILTYFPSDRFEIPGWMNESQFKKTRFEIQTRFSFDLHKNIEALTTISNQVANWILDVVLDREVSQNPYNQELHTYHATLYLALNSILQKILSSKVDTCRFAIGPRNSGQTRLSIIKDLTDKQIEIISPSIFHLSSGEISLLVLFAEIIKQYDAYPISNNFDLPNLTGIVLIDEIDKHLHIKLQKEVLPALIQLFPNLQFIVSSHSPFFALGASEVLKERARFLDFSNGGIEIQAGNVEELDNIYQQLIRLNENYKKQYEELKEKIEESSKPLIITEGKTDIIHIKKALKELKIDLELDFHDPKKPLGDDALCKFLEKLSEVSHSRKIIGIFDRDNKDIINDVGNKKDFGNDVHAFCIPIPPSRQLYKNISIEFYYSDAELKKKHRGKCMCFTNEVAEMPPQDKQQRLIKLQSDQIPKDSEFQKKIYDKNIGKEDWIHSKSVFAELVANDPDFAKDFNFSNFKLIFQKIKEIIDNS